MVSGLERQDSVVAQTIGATPYNHIAVDEWHALSHVNTLQTAE